jgi:hypothetical protein
MNKKTLRSCAPKWPQLEECVKNWTIDHRKNGIANRSQEEWNCCFNENDFIFTLLFQLVH